MLFGVGLINRLDPVLNLVGRWKFKDFVSLHPDAKKASVTSRRRSFLEDGHVIRQSLSSLFWTLEEADSGRANSGRCSASIWRFILIRVYRLE